MYIFFIVGFTKNNTYRISRRSAKMTGHPHSQSQTKEHGGRVVMEVIDKLYEQTPGFHVRKL